MGAINPFSKGVVDYDDFYVWMNKNKNKKYMNDIMEQKRKRIEIGVKIAALLAVGLIVQPFIILAVALLFGAAAFGGFVQFLVAEGYQEVIQFRMLGLVSKAKDVWHIPDRLDGWYYELAAKNGWWVPKIGGYQLQQLALVPTIELSMIGAGGLMGMRIANSLILGCLINFAIIAPIVLSKGELAPLPAAAVPTAERALVSFNAARGHLTNNWCLWWGIGMMVTASLAGLFAKPKMLISSFTGVFSKRKVGDDCLREIEFPLWVSLVGVPLMTIVTVVMNYYFFQIDPWLGLLSIPLIILLTLIAANATALTSTTPTGSLSKITQFTFGAIEPTHAATNLITAGITTEVAGNASNLLMDIKPGYMLGAKPRQQAVGHAIGIFAGALASTPLFYLLFLSDWKPGMNLQSVMAPEGGQFSFPSAVQWKGVSELVTSIFAPGGHGTLLTGSILTSMIVAAAVGLVFEIARIVTKNRFPLSPLAIGLGVLVPPDSVIAMFAGASFFAIMDAIYGRKRESFGHRLWVQTHEPICAGLVAGAALVGIGDTMIKVFVLK